VKRGSAPKRKTAFGRRAKPRKLKTAIDADRESKRMFHDAARFQRTCAVIGCRTREFQAHHVIYEQHLKDNGLPRWDTQNALRLCPLHHGRHHKRYVDRNGKSFVLETRVLTDANIDYAFAVLGPAAADYFRTYYADADEDPRIEAFAREVMLGEDAA
jgi:hypothetical protein